MQCAMQIRPSVPLVHTCFHHESDVWTKRLVLSSIPKAASTLTAFHLTHRDAVHADFQLHPSCEK